MPITPDEPKSPTLSAVLVGGPTAVLEYGGLRWLTDPTFSAPGEYEGGLVKTSSRAITSDELGTIDVVLLSHDHHADNLDPAGRSLLPHAAHVFTTKAGAERLGGRAAGLDPWETATLDRADGTRVSVTALPALHGPPGCEQVMGPVIGFLLEGEPRDRLCLGRQRLAGCRPRDRRARRPGRRGDPLRRRRPAGQAL